MMCEAVNHAHNAEFNNSLGCNISVTLSDGLFVDNENAQFAKDVTAKKLGFLDSLIRKSSPKKEKTPQSPQSSWPKIFARKPSPPQERKKPQEDADASMAKLIEQLELEGRSEEEINLHLAHIHEVPRDVPAAVPTNSPKSVNSVTQWLREVQQAIKDEFSLTTSYPYPGVEYVNVSSMTVSISSAPFYGALPPDMDMSYEELANLEPVYVGSKCVNNLPTVKHNGEPLPGDQTNCSVCLCEFTKGEQLKSLPACVHFFHKECIDRWLMVGHTCPVCKSLVE